MNSPDKDRIATGLNDRGGGETSRYALLQQIKGSVIVSCQAREGEPFNAPHFIAEFAKAAALAGAKALRINGRDNIAAVKQVVDLPVIGIRKRRVDGSPVYITPTLADVQEVIEAGADIVALDGTAGPRPGGEHLRDLAAYCRKMGVPVMADIATVEDAMFAVEQGADLLATTLAGYTEETRGRPLPAFDLLEEIVALGIGPVLLEGGINRPEYVKQALQLGAHAVVVGKAITMPHYIAGLYVAQASN
jgi:N-acylglucosamine-6-phosphate 2-epimerase